MKKTLVTAMIAMAGMLAACESDNTSRTRTASTDNTWWKNTQAQPAAPGTIPSATDPAPTSTGGWSTDSSAVAANSSAVREGRGTNDQYRNDQYRNDNTRNNNGAMASNDRSRNDYDRNNNNNNMNNNGMSNVSADARTLSIMHMLNQQEIDAGKLAQRNGNSDEVRRYGQQLAQDHSDNDNQVRSVSRSAGINLLGTDQTKQLMKDRMHDDRMNNANNNNNNNNNANNAKDGDDDPVRALQQYQGAEFDRQFASKMQKCHQMAIQMLESAQSEVSNQQVRDLIMNTLPKLREHEQMAAKLAGAQPNSSSGGW